VTAHSALDAYPDDSSFTEYTYINGNVIKSQQKHPVEIEPFIYEFDDKINSFYDANIYWNRYSYSRNNQTRRNSELTYYYHYE